MEIKITRKKIKNIIIKVNERGEVLVSAPLRVPKYYIENLIKEKEEWIRKKIDFVKSKKEKVKSNTFNDGEKFIYLGKEYLIEIKKSEEEYCKLENNKFLIYLQENNQEKRKALISKWVYENFNSYMLKKTLEIGKKIGYKPNAIKFREMKTRWGSCNSLTKSITYNYRLYDKPIEAVDYVILHELSHILYPHHQKSFWDFVGKYMPDWKKRRELLKGV